MNISLSYLRRDPTVDVLLRKDHQNTHKERNVRANSSRPDQQRLARAKCRDTDRDLVGACGHGFKFSEYDSKLSTPTRVPEILLDRRREPTARQAARCKLMQLSNRLLHCR
jgi:hypothetical protein